MARIDDPDIYNPFGWRLGDLADPDVTPERRNTLRDELLICEAEEAAHGYRHLTVVHGDPDDLEASRLLSGFYDRIGALAAECEWSRVRGEAEFVTITLRGAGADAALRDLSRVAEAANPGGWMIVESAYPHIT